jgi:hypothetical protein
VNRPPLPVWAGWRTTCAAAALLIAGSAAAQVVLSSSLVDVHRMPAGGIASGHLSLVNTTPQPQWVRLSLGDIRQAGGHIGDPGTWAHSAAPLLRVQELIQLGPRETRTIPYAIHMHPDADGTYIAALIATPAGEVREHRLERPDAGSIVILREVVRYAVEVIVDVPGNARTDLHFLDPNLTPTPAEGPEFQVRVENRGGRWAERVRYQFDLYDASSGAWIGSYPVQHGRLFPSAEHLVRIHLADLAAGSYQLLVFADVGSEDVFATRYSLDVRPRADGEPPADPQGAP